MDIMLSPADGEKSLLSINELGGVLIPGLLTRWLSIKILLELFGRSKKNSYIYIEK